MVYNIKIKPINFIGILLFILSVFLLSYSSSVKESFLIQENYLWIFYSFIAIICYSIGTFPPFMFQRLYKNINPIIIALVQFIGEAVAGIIFSLYYYFSINRDNSILNKKNNILYNLYIVIWNQNSVIQDLVRLCCCSFDFSCLMIQNNNIVCNTLLELVSALESKYRTTIDSYK